MNSLVANGAYAYTYLCVALYMTIDALTLPISYSPSLPSHETFLMLLFMFMLLSGYAVPHEWLGSLDATATDVVKVQPHVY